MPSARVAEVNVLPGSMVSGETLCATVELVGFKDPRSGKSASHGDRSIPVPRYGVDYAFLRDFYQFSESTSIHIGNLVGYESGANTVPIFLDVNTLATEHLAVLAMTGSGKSYAVGRIIERLVGQMNGTVVVFDPHGEYGWAVEGGNLRTNPGMSDVQDPRDQEALPRIVENLNKLAARGGGIESTRPRIPISTLSTAAPTSGWPCSSTTSTSTPSGASRLV